MVFEKVFSFFKGLVFGELGKKKKRVILFLMDGKFLDIKKDFIFCIIRDKNVEFNNFVIILMYGFGNVN